MNPRTTAIEFFGVDELRCKGSGIIKLDPRFAKELPELRRAWGKPLLTNSICRSPEHNVKVNGNKTSLHLTDNPKWKCHTMAADIRWRDWTEADQLKFAKLALSMGWRVGLHNGFCHLDRLLDIAPHYSKVFLYGDYTGKLHAKLA